ncbi:aminoacyl-tRNA deacylase [Streptomyces tirandamycinicus]|uniref:aminoacyl-tRNA deacylase n=1 Tax=Streptomyces tirandamycinicus TaxID=2174846 RepID=UPI00226F99D3|nr:YbaK/EbsC family protein [Streptomyces tirandamycinicus]MCY0981582.1 YbaK/EbsC family protein [Streptomyces tirandamycinicus]
MESLPTTPHSTALRLLEGAGAAYIVHRHEPIRTGEDILAHTAFTQENVVHSVKTLAFSSGSDSIVLASIPGPGRIRYGQLAAAVGVRRSDIRPASPEILQRLGMEPGGVTPLCADPLVTVVFDTAVTTMGRVLCGSGSSDHTLEADLSDIMKAVPQRVVADIASL